MPQIEHVIVLMMENHSYDNYLGLLGRGDGFALGPDGQPAAVNLTSAGRPVRAFHMPNTCQFAGKPSQSWNASHEQWDHGKMDGFVRSDSGPVAMGYWTGQDLPFYYGLASTFPVCDRWFASCLAQTYPNRRFLLAGTARGNIRTETATLTDPPPPNGTIMDALDRHGIAWKNYYSNLPTLGLYLPVLATNPDKVVKVAQFFSDAAAGTLPAFAIVDPEFDETSEENPQDISRGEAFAAQVIDAVLHSPAWSKTMLVWCYDEHGGYYDHVPPPPAVAPDDVPPKLQPGDVPGSYAQYGMRVPAVVVSPWARRNYVSSVVHDHTSILSFLEHKYNLPALTNRDGAADNLLDCLDLSGTAPFAVAPSLPRPRNGTGRPLCTAPGALPTAG
jgi:phospholipase C